jgi:hypothetical protein
MSLWRRRDERYLRKALKRRVKHRPEIRKKLRKAPKALCYRPIASTVTWGLGYALLFLLPGLVVHFATMLPDDAQVWAAAPFALAYAAWLGSAALFTRLWTGPETILYPFLPIGAKDGFANALRAAAVCAFILPVGAILAVCGLLLIQHQPISAIALHLLHLPAMLVTIPCCLCLRRRLPPFTVGLTLVLLCVATLFRAYIPLGAAGPLLAFRYLLPNGWVQLAIEAINRNAPIEASAWLLTIPAATTLAVWLLRRERHTFITTLETAEPENCDLGEIPLAEGWDRASWLERLVQKCVCHDQHPVLELMRGGSFDWSRRWKRGLYFALAAGICSLPSNIFCLWGAIALAAIGILAATPALGGAWPGLQGSVAPHGTAYMLSVYPVSLRDAARAAMRVNLIRGVAALPHWVLLGWAIGRTFAIPAAALLAAGMVWVTAVAWLPAVTLLNMTQLGVVCIRGKWWRYPISGILLLLWLVHAGASFILAVTTAVGATPFIAWLIVMLSMGIAGAILTRTSLHQITSHAFDHLVSPPQNPITR